jgi:hypothetical protein
MSVTYSITLCLIAGVFCNKKIKKELKIKSSSGRLSVIGERVHKAIYIWMAV